jgi:UDP-N-acetyl-D-mannosaminuronic acid dehydrogenase
MIKEEFTHVSIIGLGYIGLPTAAVLASRGVNIIGIDVNPEIVATINDGRIHIVEPDLDVLVHGAVHAGKLRAYTTPQKAQAFLIAVPTPITSDHQPDMTYVEKATRSIAPVLEKGNLVVLESTSPVGSTELMARWLSEERPDLTFPQQAGESADVCVAYCPERVLPGAVVYELVRNDRVIGGMTSRCAGRARDLYQTFVQGDCLTSDAKTAEMTKLTENAFRDVNIAFANELSLICDKIGIDVWDLISLANRHPRVNILRPGPGVGGHCIAIDPWFIVASAPQQSRLIRQSREVNDHKPQWVIGKVHEAIASLKRSQGNVSVACLGVAFKANIDDLRESPSLNIVQALAKDLNTEILVVEPYIKQLPNALNSSTNVKLSGLAEALDKSNIVVLLVDHDDFRGISVEALKGKVIIDTRGMIRKPQDGLSIR